MVGYYFQQTTQTPCYFMNNLQNSTIRQNALSPFKVRSLCPPYSHPKYSGYRKQFYRIVCEPTHAQEHYPLKINVAASLPSTFPTYFLLHSHRIDRQVAMPETSLYHVYGEWRKEWRRRGLFCTSIQHNAKRTSGTARREREKRCPCHLHPRKTGVAGGGGGSAEIKNR